MNTNTRINLGGTTLDAIVKMSEGNPGAAVALSSLMQVCPENGLTLILWLDEFGIYGTDIYVLWSDICKKDTLKMSKVIQATSQRKFDVQILKDACSRQDYSGVAMVPLDTF